MLRFLVGGTSGMTLQVVDSNIQTNGDVNSHNILNVFNNVMDDVYQRIERILGPYVVKEARLDRFHKSCYPGTRTELLDQGAENQL
jgi:hypothetical protein